MSCHIFIQSVFWFTFNRQLLVSLLTMSNGGTGPALAQFSLEGDGWGSELEAADSREPRWEVELTPTVPSLHRLHNNNNFVKQQRRRRFQGLLPR